MLVQRHGFTLTGKNKVGFSHSEQGFSLVEVLITLSIIGMVAAMTLPNLLNQANDAELKAKWKKEYSQLEQVSRLFLQENSTLLGVSNYADSFKTYYKVTKYCANHASAEGCWVESGQNLFFNKAVAGIPDNLSANKDLGSGQGFVLLDGTTFSTYGYWSAACNYRGYICGWILIDVNGFKKPNTVGRDVFGVWVFPDKISPMGITNYNYPFAGQCADTGYGCSAEYLYK